MPRAAKAPAAKSTDDTLAKRAFVYCRVSTDEQSQDNHYSLALQEERCRGYAEQKGWRVARARKDVGSGRNDERPGFQDLLKDVAAGAIDVVIVYRLDRLSRNVRDVYGFLEETREANVGFVSTSESFDTTCAMGRAMLGVAAVFAQLTREMIGENVRDGMAKRAQAGKYNGPKHVPRYGYTYSVEQGQLLVEPAEAEVVRTVFDLFAHQKWGITRIARYLNSQGIPGKLGAEWGNRRIGGMLRSPVYIGKLSHNGVIYDGEHEPIIDQDIFDEAQALIGQRSTLPPRSHQSQHLLSGLVRCGYCGTRLAGHWNHYNTRHAGRRKYRMYRHPATARAGDGRCPGIAKSAEKLEAEVVGKIREVAASAAFQEAAFAEASRRLASDLPQVQRDREAVQSQLAETAAKFESWAGRLDAGQIDEEQFTRWNAALLEKKAKLEEQLAELEARAAEQGGVQIDLEQVRQMLRDFDTTWAHLTLDEQREMLRALIEELSVWKDRAELKLVLMPPVEIDLRFARGRGLASGGRSTVR